MNHTTGNDSENRTGILLKFLSNCILLYQRKVTDQNPQSQNIN